MAESLAVRREKPGSVFTVPNSVLKLLNEATLQRPRTSASFSAQPVHGSGVRGVNVGNPSQRGGQKVQEKKTDEIERWFGAMA